MDPSWAYVGRPNGIDATRQLLRSLALWAVSTWSSRCFFLGGEQLPTPTYKISCFLVGKAIFGPVRHCQALCLLMLYKCCFILMHGKSPALTNPMKFVCVILLFLSNKCLSNFFQIWPTDLCVWRVDGLSSVEKECRIHWKRPQRGRREVHLFWLYRTMWW